jgi:hypothetical protein
MPDPIPEYHVVTFESAEAAATAQARILEFVGSPKGIAWMTDPIRAVIWSGPPTSKQPTLYLSTGALEVSRALALDLHATRLIRADELPGSRALVLGDDSDWHQ